MKTTGYNSITSWIATVACFTVRLLVTLPMRLAGLFFVIILEQFDTDRENATYPFVIFGFLRTISGPLVGYLGEIFGLRCTTVTGCVLASVGIGVAFFLNDVISFIFVFGFIYGMGLGIGCNLLSTILKQHFNKDHNFVNGIVLSGSCIGAVVMPPLIQYLCDQYGASGMYLILSGIVLNSVPAAIFLFDPKNDHNSQKFGSVCDIPNYVKTTSVPDNAKIVQEKPFKSELLHNSKTNIGNKNKSYNYKTFVDKISFTDASLVASTSNKFKHAKFYKLSGTEEEQKVNITCKDVKLLKYSTKNDFKNEMFVAIEENKGKERTNGCGNTIIPHVPLILDDSIDSKQAVNKKSMLKLFMDPTYIIIMMTQGMHSLNTTLNWTICLDYAHDKGISSDISLQLVMLLPVSETIGNLCLNWIADRGYMTRTNFCIVCYLILVLDSLCLTWAGTFTSMMICIVVFGILCGAVATSFPGIILDYIDGDQQNMALASRYVPYAFLCLSKAPLIGYFRIGLGSYDYIFYIISSLFLLSGLLTFFIPAFSKRR